MTIMNDNEQNPRDSDSRGDADDYPYPPHPGEGAPYPPREPPRQPGPSTGWRLLRGAGIGCAVFGIILAMLPFGFWQLIQLALAWLTGE